MFGFLKSKTKPMLPPMTETEYVLSVGGVIESRDDLEARKLKREVNRLKREAWIAKRDAAVSALEKPESLYRLVRIAETGCWRVETWRVMTSEVGYDHKAYLADANRFYLGPNNLKSRYPDYDTAPRAWIEWRRFGPHESFDSFDAAEAWLRGWLKPIGDVVYPDFCKDIKDVV